MIFTSSCLNFAKLLFFSFWSFLNKIFFTFQNENRAERFRDFINTEHKSINTEQVKNTQLIIVNTEITEIALVFGAQAPS